MPRVLIISEHWPPAAEALIHSGFTLADTIAQAGFGVDVVTNGSGSGASGGAVVPHSIIRLPLEPVRETGFLFALRNALAFGAAANPGNYAMLRDRLHMHLQEVLYDTVVILCPPRIYLRLGFWIDETFGIPIWIHLQRPDRSAEPKGFVAWNHRRLEKKYLAAAKIISAESAELLPSKAGAESQLRLLADPENKLHFSDPRRGTLYDMNALLNLVSRKQGNGSQSHSRIHVLSLQKGRHEKD